MVKVLFLDIDGVLNSKQSARYYKRQGKRPYKNLCPIASSNLQFLMELIPDIKIVISSTWRISSSLGELRKLLNCVGIPKESVIGVTPKGSDRGIERGHEIQGWLDLHTDVKNFVILDDDSDMLHLSDHLIQTETSHGLMYEDMLKIVNKFKVFGATIR